VQDGVPTNENALPQPRAKTNNFLWGGGLRGPGSLAEGGRVVTPPTRRSVCNSDKGGKPAAARELPQCTTDVV